MTPPSASAQPRKIRYPSSDGKPMGESTEHLEKIFEVLGFLSRLFHDRRDVLLAADLFWYPVEGNPKIRVAPDVLAAFGAPYKPKRESYLQWKEGNLPIHVAFEFLSKSNREKDLEAKFAFYQAHGTEEYYLYDLRKNLLHIWLRQGEILAPVERTEGFVSPRLGVRLETRKGTLRLFAPEGGDISQPFKDVYLEQKRARALAESEYARAEEERARAEAEHARAEEERARAERLAEKLRSLGIDPE